MTAGTAGRGLVEAARHRTVEVGPGLHLHIAELGPEDGAPVLLLHGFPEAWFSWRHQLPALAAAGFRVIAPDLRGYGGSSAPRGVLSYRVERLVGDLLALQRALGLHRSHVVGHDWGGLLAWVMAMDHPAQVHRLGILNAPHPAPFLRELLGGRQLLESWYMLAFQLPRLPELLLSRPGVLEKLVSGPGRALSEEERTAYRTAFPSPESFTGPLNWYRAMVRFDLWTARSRIRPVQAPTRVIWGEEDPVLGLPLLDGLDAVVDELDVVRVPGAGHFVQADAPGPVNDALVDWLAR